MPKLKSLEDKHSYQAYGIVLLENKHKKIRKLKKIHQPSVHGHKTWNASFVLMDYLQHRPIRKGADVLELGSGWGPGAIFCAKRFKASVTALDVDKDVFPFLDAMAEGNGVQIAHWVKNFEKLSKKDLGQFQVIVGSDICFWDSLVPILKKLVRRAMAAGVERVVITDPGRPTFYELCDALAKDYKVRLNEWYATEPEYFEGEVVEITPK